MFSDFDPRDDDPRDRDDAIRDCEEDWRVLGRGPGSAALRDEPAEPVARDRDDDWRDERAIWWPARRAAATDPAVALRAE